MADRKLIVEIIGDDSSLQRTFKNSSVGARKFGKDIDGVAGKSNKLNQSLRGALSVGGGAGGFLFGSGAFVGSAIATAAIVKSIDAASDLNEQLTKNQQVFGASAKVIESWSETTSRAIGVSQEAALEATGTFGNLFKAIGVGEQESAATSRRLVQLAADMASFNNADPTQVLQDIRSGLVGEAEPLRKYGVLLSEARVQQLALKQTGKDSVKSLTDQEKALARVAIIFKDTTAAQGDFARTSGGLANQERILKAEVADLEANLGRLLLPAITDLVGVLTDATGAAVRLTDGLTALGNIKIPPIHIPFFFDFPGGGSIKDIGGKAFDVAKFTPLNPFLIETIGLKIADQFKDDAEGQTPKLADAFASSLNSMFDNALTSADDKVKAKGAKKVKGFGTGLTPEDLFGPLVTDIPKKLQEALLDVQIKSPDNAQALVGVLEKQRDVLLKALDDPRLTQDQTIALKEKLRAIVGAIGSENDQIASAVKAASDARTAKLQEAARASAEAKEKQKAALQRIADHRREVAEAAAKALQAKQFRALGLTATGDQTTPGVDNLKKQLSQLTDRLGADVSPKIASQLAGIGKVLSGALGKVTLDTRQKIVELFDTIRGTFEDQGKKPLTKTTSTTSLNANKILEGLGLGPEATKALRARLSHFNSAGVALAGAPAGSVGAFGMSVPSQPIVIHNQLELDGRVVAKNTTKHQQVRSRRNPPQKRGPHGI